MRWMPSLGCVAAMGAALMTTAVASAATADGELPRRGCLGVQVFGTTTGMMIVGVVPEGPAQRAGLQPMDQIVALNGSPIADATPSGYLRGLAEGEEVTLTLRRSGADREVTLRLAAPRTPDIPDALTEFGEVRMESGARVRTIRTVPFGGADRLRPAVLFIQNTDCATIDPEVPPGDGWTDLVESVAQQGYVTMRIDKPSVGDSEGPDCASMDYWAEVEIFRSAMAALVADARVDPTRVFIIATRGGTTIAPLLAREIDVAGVCVFSPVVRPWFEHTMTQLRRQSADWSMPPLQAEKMLHDCAELLTRVMVLGEEPDAVVAADASLAPLAQSLGGDRLFGRSAAFHAQLNDADIAAAWVMAETNVLVLRGEYDRYSIEADQHLIERLVNGATGTLAWTATIARTDPDMNPQPGPDYYKTKWSAIDAAPNPELRETIVEWMEYALARREGKPEGAPDHRSLQAERPAAAQPES